MNALKAYRTLASNGPLARLLLGEFISGIGNWLYLVALLVVIYRVSGDPILLGLVGAARILPYVFLSVPAGMLADRVDRRFVLITSDVVRGALMLVLAWLAMTNGSPAAMIVVAVLATCFATLFYPAIGAMIPALARDESEFGPANSANETLNMLAFVLGPALGGILVAASDLAIAFLLNAVSFAVSAVVVWGLPPSKPKRAAAVEAAVDGAIVAAPVEAERTVGTPEATDEPVSEPAVGTTLEPDAEQTLPRPSTTSAPPGSSAWRAIPRRAVAGVFAVDLSGSYVAQSMLILTVILAGEVYKSGDEAVGWLNSAIGIGGVAGALVTGVLVLRRSLAPALLVGAVTAGIAILALALTHDLRIAFVLLLVYASAGIAIDVCDATIFQRVVPDELRGRASGVWVTVNTLFQVLGAATAPLLFTVLGLPLLAILGALLIGGGIVAVVLIGPAAVREPTDFELELMRARRLPVFVGLPASRLDHALRRLRPVTFAPGESIVRQGEPADRFYIISSGRVAVTIAESPGGPDRHVRDLGPDEVFGEIGLLTQAPRTATVTAIDEVVCLALPGPEFIRLVSSTRGATDRFLHLYEATPPPVETPLEGVSAATA